MLKLFTAIAALAAVMLGGVARAYDNLDMNTVTVGGVERSVGLYVPPSYNAATPAPLIVALHNRFSSAKGFHALSHLRALADQRGAILLYPETTSGYWNDGGFGVLKRPDPPLDDARFIASAIDAVRTSYTIDDNRTFLIGYDAGGLMSYRLLCDGRVHFAGAAIVSALMWDYISSDCANARATPLLIMHGRRDEVFPIAGADAPDYITTARRLSAQATSTFWQRVNGCADAPNRGGITQFTGCTKAPLTYIEVPGGEHEFFRADAGYAISNGNVDAANVIGNFFFDTASFAAPQMHAPAARARSALFYAPPRYNPATPTPLVVVLHGRPQTAYGIAQDTQWNALARQRDFLVVYPEGIDHQWNSFNDLVANRRGATPQNDQAFLETLVSDLSRDFNIDRRRVYMTGFSNGGFMTIRMTCTSSDHFAAFAAVGAGLYSAVTSRCRGRPAPFLLIQGTGDESVPYGGVVQTDATGGEPTRISLGAQDTVAFFIRRNGCSFTGQSMNLAESGRSPGTSVIRFAPRDCANGADVLFYLVNGGSHSWPGLPDSGPPTINMDFNATEAIWDFFRTHELPEADASNPA